MVKSNYIKVHIKEEEDTAIYVRVAVPLMVKVVDVFLDYGRTIKASSKKEWEASKEAFYITTEQNFKDWIHNLEKVKEIHNGTT